MNLQHPNDPSIMARLFGKMPLHSEFFVIRRVDTRGTKMDIPSSPIRSHIHCFFFIIEGEVLITIGNESCFFKENECAAIQADQLFSVRYFDNCIGYMGGFNTEFLNCSNDGKNIIQAFSILRRWGAHKVLFDNEHSKYITDIFERLYVENSIGKNKNIIRAYLTTLLTEIEEASCFSNKGNSFRTENELCNKFIELAFQYSNHSIPLSEYAVKLSITKDHLHKIVKYYTEKTPLMWIIEAVILEAKVLLCQTGITISEISSLVGMNDPSYFSRLFKKQMGMTPLEYREAQKS